MQLEVHNPAFKAQRLTVEAAGVFHGPRLLLNGTVVKKQKGRYTVTTDSGVETTIQLKYIYLDPIPKIKIGEETFEIASSLKWYEYVWIGIPIVLMFSGGAIGGLCGGVAAYASGRLFRSDRSSLAKYGLSALITMGAVVAFVVLGTVFQLLVGTTHNLTMSAQFIAKLADLAIMITTGVIALLMGLRVIGPKPGINEKYDVFHSKWGKHFRWLGPLIIVMSLLEFGASIFAENISFVESQQKARQKIHASVSSSGKLADQNQVVDAPEGFRVMIPKGFTFKELPDKAPALIAIFDFNGAATPVISVSVFPPDGSLEQVIESTKTLLIAKNKTYKFSETQIIDEGLNKIYRTSLSMQRDGVNVKGGMLFFENEGKVFSLTYVTQENLFDTNAAVFERVVHSFGPAANSGLKSPAAIPKTVDAKLPVFAPPVVAPVPTPSAMTVPTTPSVTVPSATTTPTMNPSIIPAPQSQVSQLHRNKKRHSDLRYCLELKTDAEIAACSAGGT